MRKTSLATQPRLSGPCKDFKFSVMEKENFGSVMLKEIFYYILKVSQGFVWKATKAHIPCICIRKTNDYFKIPFQTISAQKRG